MPRDLIVNMDETAIYFESNTTRTVHPKGSNKVVIRGSESSNQRFSACISAVSDETKLLLIVILQGRSMGYIERNLHKVLTDNVYCSCQTKAWMDRRCMKMWVENVWKSDKQHSPQSLLLLVDFVFQSNLQLSVCVKGFVQTLHSYLMAIHAYYSHVTLE